MTLFQQLEKNVTKKHPKRIVHCLLYSQTLNLLFQLTTSFSRSLSSISISIMCKVKLVVFQIFDEVNQNSRGEINSNENTNLKQPREPRIWSDKTSDSISEFLQYQRTRCTTPRLFFKKTVKKLNEIRQKMASQLHQSAVEPQKQKTNFNSPISSR